MINLRPLTAHIKPCYNHKMAIALWPWIVTSFHPMYKKRKPNVMVNYRILDSILNSKQMQFTLKKLRKMWLKVWNQSVGDWKTDKLRCSVHVQRKQHKTATFICVWIRTMTSKRWYKGSDRNASSVKFDSRWRKYEGLYSLQCFDTDGWVMPSSIKV